MKNNTISNVICVAFCISLIAFTLYGSNFFSGKIIGAAEKCVDIKSELNLSKINDNAPVEVNTIEIPTAEIPEETPKSTDLTETPQDILDLMKSAENLYKGFKKTGNIKEQTFGATSNTTTYGSVKLNNKAGANVDIKALLNTKMSLGTITKEKPYILIYHTHTTEGYELLDKGWYSDDYNSRTKDSAKNMVRVGDALAEQLEEAGFKVIHDINIYDSSYNGAYSRSLVSVNKYLKEYPSIMITLDVHRDAIHYDNGTKSKPTVTVNGKKAAQVMIITGCEGNGVEGFPDWKKNLIFSLNLQNTVEESYQSLMRPIFFCNRKYNMNVTPCSLLLEFGTDANTLEEAVYSAKLVGKSLGELLNKEMEKM
ncbi:MAG: stage II sporulation protein P [Acutalibacteraceae bacterium]